MLPLRFTQIEGLYSVFQPVSPEFTTDYTREQYRRSHIADKNLHTFIEVRIIVNTLFTNHTSITLIRWQSELNRRLKTFSRCFRDNLNSDLPFGTALPWLPFSSSDTLGILKYDSLAHCSSLRRQHCRSQSSARY